MKKELKYIDELDFILHFLATNPDDEESPLKTRTDGETIYDILEQLNSERTINKERLIKILNKLSNDKYVEEKAYKGSQLPQLQYRPQTRYKITFDGLVQDEIGGYRAIHLENNKLKNIQKWQFRLTLYIGLGAIVASIYYILEIIKFFSN